MKNTQRVVAAIAGAVGLATVTSGAAWASTRPARPQTFVLYNAGSTFGGENTVVASGAISGIGTERILTDNSSQGTQEFTSELVFPDGTVTMDVHGSDTTTVDPRTCAGNVTGHVTWTITGGTGAYDGATGSGTGRYTDRFVLQRDANGCKEDAPVAQVFEAHERGTANV